MNKELMKFKEDLLKTGMFISRPKAGEYTLKECVYCGDMKNHLYVNIDLSSDKPVLYKCFKCNSAGIVGSDFVKRMGIEDITIPKYNGYKKVDIQSTISTKIPEVNVTPEDDIRKVSQYIYSRIGICPTLTELQMFGYIGKPDNYVRMYLGDGNMWMINANERCWFKMTNGNIIGRLYNDDEPRWLKYKTDRVRTAGLYNIRVPFDLHEEINVVIAEGIMDVLGLYYNYKELSNCIYVGVMGKDYIKGIKFILGKGIFGTDVNIHIFKDPNVDAESIHIDNNLRKLFGKIDIYENLNELDYGIKPELLDIHKVHINKKRKRFDDHGN